MERVKGTIGFSLGIIGLGVSFATVSFLLEYSASEIYFALINFFNINVVTYENFAPMNKLPYYEESLRVLRFLKNPFLQIILVYLIFYGKGKLLDLLFLERLKRKYGEVQTNNYLLSFGYITGFVWCVLFVLVFVISLIFFDDRDIGIFMKIFFPIIAILALPIVALMLEKSYLENKM